QCAPRGRRALGRADRERAVRGKVLQLDRPGEDRRVETRERIGGDVLDTGRVVGVQDLAAHGVAGDDALTPASDTADQRTLEVEPLRSTLAAAHHQALPPILRTRAR